MTDTDKLKQSAIRAPCTLGDGSSAMVDRDLYPQVQGWALIARAEDIGVTWCYHRRDGEREVWWSADDAVRHGVTMALQGRWGVEADVEPGSLLDLAAQAIVKASGGMARPEWARHLASEVLAVVEAHGAKLD